MVELADIFRIHGAEYRARYGDRMLPSHLRAMDDIEHCRTAALGGSVYACPSCADELQYSYHSCGNRACPKCGNDETSRWLDQQGQFLLPTDYFMVTYTLPQECRTVARSNQRSVYSAFFRASAQTFMELAAQPKHLGGLTGLMGVLQTWRRDMAYHPHIHYLVPGGALADDHSAWLPHRYADWLLPERALARSFKMRFQRELETLGLLPQVDPAVWHYDKLWVVDSIPVGNGETVLKYLAPYVQRIALANHRIVALHGGKVTFRFKSREDPQWRYMTLPAERFIARFLQHVLPQRFIKIRYYGFLTAKVRGELLAQIRQLLCPLQRDLGSPALAPSSCTPSNPSAVTPQPALPAAQPAACAPPLCAAHDRCETADEQTGANEDGVRERDFEPTPDQRRFRRCSKCGHPMILLRQLRRQYTATRDPPP